jgi:hypothetical protein
VSFDTSARRVAARASLSLSLGLLGCAPAPAPLFAEGTAAWQRGLARLAEVRAAAAPDVARTMRVSLTLREPVTGHVLRARGAVAIRPPASLRMILVGPGGATALDLWTRGDRFRFAVPAIGLVRRGDASTPRAELRGMPIDFLRGWMLRPAAGTLLWHARTADADRFVLRDGAATVDWLARDDGRVSATRATFGPRGEGAPTRIEIERFEASGLGCADVVYTQASTGLVVDARCEGEDRDHPPSPRAFEDPEAEAAR